MNVNTFMATYTNGTTTANEASVWQSGSYLDTAYDIGQEPLPPDLGLPYYFNETADPKNPVYVEGYDAAQIVENDVFNPAPDPKHISDTAALATSDSPMPGWWLTWTDTNQQVLYLDHIDACWKFDDYVAS